MGIELKCAGEKVPPACPAGGLIDDVPCPDGLGYRRQRKYWNAAKPVQPTIVSRSDSDTVQQDWYFSCGDKSIFLSGYRRYERDATGGWYIAARWYPEVHTLDNVIPIEGVPFPDDVVKEAIEKGYRHMVPPSGFEVFRSGECVMVNVDKGDTVEQTPT